MSDTDNPILEPGKLLYGDDSQEPQELTENAEISEDEPADENETQEEVTEGQVEEQAEGSEESNNYVIEIPGKDGESRELNLDTILEWEKGHMMQSDYTKKTMALAKDKSEFEASKAAEIEKVVSSKYSALENSITELELIIKDAEEAIDWDELRDYDSSEYIRQKELKDKRVKALEDAKQAKKQAEDSKINDPDYIKREQGVLIANNPHWLDEQGNQTEAHKKDIERMSKYLVARGITKEQQEKIVTAQQWQVYLDASKHWDSNQKVDDVKKQVKKIKPTMKTKRSVKPSQPKTLGQAFYN